MFIYVLLCLYTSCFVYIHVLQTCDVLSIQTCTLTYILVEKFITYLCLLFISTVNGWIYLALCRVCQTLYWLGVHRATYWLQQKSAEVSASYSTTMLQSADVHSWIIDASVHCDVVWQSCKKENSLLYVHINIHKHFLDPLGDAKLPKPIFHKVLKCCWQGICFFICSQSMWDSPVTTSSPYWPLL